jgi:hypothetical protein
MYTTINDSELLLVLVLVVDVVPMVRNKHHDLISGWKTSAGPKLKASVFQNLGERLPRRSAAIY